MFCFLDLLFFFTSARVLDWFSECEDLALSGLDLLSGFEVLASSFLNLVDWCIVNNDIK